MNLEFNIAVHVLAFLNQHHGEVFNSKALAQNVCVNPVQLRRVMSKLQQEGYIQVVRGQKGGYLATEEGQSIQLEALFHLFNRPDSHGRLFTGHPSIHCEISQKIEQVMYGHYLTEQEIIANYYQNQTIGDILNQIKEVEASMKKYDLIVIGFGKAGKTLAKFAAQQGKQVAVIEKSAEMYGGTCINVGCIPSKVLVHDGIEAVSFNEAMQRKREVVSALNNKNYHNLADEATVDVINMAASFKSAHEIELLNADGEHVQTIEGAHIVINTGAQSVIPNIKGVDTSQRVYDSKGMMDLTTQPKRLVIVGGGYIALEFAAMFANFGTEVTVLERAEHILGREDEAIAQQVAADLTQKGIQFVYNAESEAIQDEVDVTKVVTTQGTFEADAVLVATGRQPNTEGLNIEAAGVELGQRGEIIVNDKLQTSVDHIYAVGDVNGGLQFTYISLDDFRIVKSQLFGDGQRTLEQRGAVPYTMFIDPPMSRVGLTAAEARQQGYDILENQVPVNAMPRHKINNDARGLFKVVVDAQSGQVLGATLYGQQSEELINIVKLAMDQQLPYAVLRDNIYTHPTMAESFNDLFNF